MQVSADKITVKGSNGTLTRATTGLVKVTHENGKVAFAPANESVAANAMSGTMRALVNNMVNGVSEGFVKKLALWSGWAFARRPPGAKVNLLIGYSHPMV